MTPIGYPRGVVYSTEKYSAKVKWKRLGMETDFSQSPPSSVSLLLPPTSSTPTSSPTFPFASICSPSFSFCGKIGLIKAVEKRHRFSRFLFLLNDKFFRTVSLQNYQFKWENESTRSFPPSSPMKFPSLSF